MTHFLHLPEQYVASIFYHKSNSTPDICTVNITDIAVAYFSPGVQYNPHTTLIRADGSAASLFYQVEKESRGPSPEAHKHHRALIALIHSTTAQNLIEIGEEERPGGTGITNVNPAQALAFLYGHKGQNLSVFAKGLSGASGQEIKNQNIHATLMTDIAAAMPNAGTVRFQMYESDHLFTVNPSAIRAVWQNFGAVFVWLDGIKEPVALSLDQQNPKISDHVVDEIVSLSDRKLRGAHLGTGIHGPTAFFGHPEDIANIQTGADDRRLGVSFIDTAHLITESYKEPVFSFDGGAAKAMKNLLLAFG